MWGGDRIRAGGAAAHEKQGYPPNGPPTTKRFYIKYKFKKIQLLWQQLEEGISKKVWRGKMIDSEQRKIKD